MKHKPAHFPKFLIFVVMLFVVILIYVWVEAKNANPVMLDEKGNPRSAAPR